jgi:hypothetical protein
VDENDVRVDRLLTHVYDAVLAPEGFATFVQTFIDHFQLLIQPVDATDCSNRRAGVS